MKRQELSCGSALWSGLASLTTMSPRDVSSKTLMLSFCHLTGEGRAVLVVTVRRQLAWRWREVEKLSLTDAPKPKIQAHFNTGFRLAVAVAAPFRCQISPDFRAEHLLLTTEQKSFFSDDGDRFALHAGAQARHGCACCAVLRRKSLLCFIQGLWSAGHAS